MTRKELFISIRESQKARAKLIRELKHSRKQDVRTRLLWVIEYDIAKNKKDYRHYHIAYCELRGRKREEIEIPKDNNEASESRIEEIKSHWNGLLDEDVRFSA